jgi:ATP-dependent DNA helicase RecQ
MALSAILRTGEWFGMGHLIDILLGNKTDKVLQRAHDELPTFGVGKGTSKAEWQAIFRQMMGYDLIRPDPERHGGLRFTENARPLLKGTAEILLRKDSILAANDRRPAVKLLVSDEDAPLLSALKAKRRALAEQQKVPAYIVFNDKTLIEMAERRPKDLDEMASVGGVGAKKLERYGQAFLSVVTGEEGRVHPTRRKMAGLPEAEVFDQLLIAQQGLEGGGAGSNKLLSCSRTTLKNIAKLRPQSLDKLGQVPGMNNARTERFGEAFIEILQSL